MNYHIGNNIKALRYDKNLSQGQLADIAGVTQQTISLWESGNSIPRQSAIQNIIEHFPELNTDSILSDGNGYFKVSSQMLAEKKSKDSLDRVMKEYEPLLRDIANKLHQKEDPYINVPLYGSIAAGTPIEMIEVDDTFPIPTRMHELYPDAFLLKVVGSSMNRILPDGCYALIDPCDDIEVDNKPYAVCVNGHDATIKRVHKLANGFELVPDSTDPTFKARVYDYGEEGTEKITVIGRVVYHVIPFDWSY